MPPRPAPKHLCYSYPPAPSLQVAGTIGIWASDSSKEKNFFLEETRQAKGKLLQKQLEILILIRLRRLYIIGGHRDMAHLIPAPEARLEWSQSCTADIEWDCCLKNKTPDERSYINVLLFCMQRYNWDYQKHHVCGVLIVYTQQKINSTEYM